MTATSWSLIITAMRFTVISIFFKKMLLLHSDFLKIANAESYSIQIFILIFVASSIHCNANQCQDREGVYLFLNKWYISICYRAKDQPIIRQCDGRICWKC